MASFKNVVHSFKTHELNDLHLSWLKTRKDLGPSEASQSIGLGSFTYNNSLYGAIHDIRTTVHSFEQLPIHRIVKAITIWFECPITFPPEAHSKETNIMQCAGYPSRFRKMIGAKPSEIRLKIAGRTGSFNLDIGDSKDFWGALGKFLTNVQEMHNMIAVWKHANRAKDNITKHGYDGAIRELNELKGTVSKWMAIGGPLS